MAEESFLSVEWEVQGLRVADVLAREVEVVAALHRSRSATGAVDPSFQPATDAEYAELVNASVRGENEGKPFRLQIFRDSGGEPRGYFHAFGDHPRPGYFFISMFFVTPERERRGIGSAVCRGLLIQAQLLGFERAMVCVFLANRQALRFWIGHGFDRIEKFRRLEETGKPDCLVLERPLSA